MMGILNHSGIDQLLVLARKENPWLPNGALTQNIRVTDVTVKDGKATGTFSGRYGHGYDGHVRVTYTTLDLAALFSGKPLTVGVLEPKPLYELLDDIFKYTGIKLGAGDIENQEPGNELPYTVKLKAKPLSAVYTGEVDITFHKRGILLDEVVVRGDYDIEFRAFSTNVTDRARGEHLTYGNDYTHAVSAIKSTPTGVLTEVLAKRLSETLNAVDGLPWAYSAAESFWSLLNCNVEYNGPVLALDSVIPNLRFTHVMVVDMAVDHGSGDMFGSKLYIHYNVLE